MPSVSSVVEKADKPVTGEPKAPPAFLTERDAASYVCMSRFFLRQHRQTGRGGPPYVRLGRSVRYRVVDLEAWLRDATITPRAR